ncbi:hypothetical protein SAMN04487897_101152 [Paenibacillus sp. yr247]|uniref:esterase/lipase family protein n=1 Tax=Paenibacillus sp. yr247 TaxID=1761880 RepID=UPI00087F29A8|nr:alpha/beta fold hydrolase [Paenibacillus sp. yr247]SDM82037.1 hypothetical protein SAMN04487897_101152 [Paenibacillus sp. yr247]
MNKKPSFIPLGMMAGFLFVSRLEPIGKIGHTLKHLDTKGQMNMTFQHSNWPYYWGQAYPSDLRWSPSYPPYAQPWPLSYPTQDALWDEEQLRVKQQPLTFVLIHGSWADASYWNGIAAELRKHGHTVYAPEYPGHGADPNKAVTHATIPKASPISLLRRIYVRSYSSDIVSAVR